MVHLSYIRGLGRRVRSVLSAARAALFRSRLEDIDFPSGLGDSSYLLYGLVKSAKPAVVVEIGSARGRSTCFIGMALKENGSGKLYAIDPHTRNLWNDEDSVYTYNTLFRNVGKFELESYVEIMKATSEEIARQWHLPIDILFIDGDHSYEGVKRDWEVFSQFVQPFGCVVFHDTLWDLKPDPKYRRPDMGVPRFVDELRLMGYPAITLDRDFGVSLIQPVRRGVSLFRHQSQTETGVSAG
jgi:predicted O-methyltransferase YrrM